MFEQKLNKMISGKTRYHAEEHLKGRTTEKLSASQHLPAKSKRTSKKNKKTQFRSKRLTIVHGFWSETETFDFG